jgi:hypothetical protein
MHVVAIGMADNLSVLSVLTVEKAFDRQWHRNPSNDEDVPNW